MTNKLTEEKKKVLRETISGKSSDCTDCSYDSYKIKNVQFTKEEYLKFQNDKYTKEDLK